MTDYTGFEEVFRHAVEMAKDDRLYQVEIELTATYDDSVNDEKNAVRQHLQGKAWEVYATYARDIIWWLGGEDNVMEMKENDGEVTLDHLISLADSLLEQGMEGHCTVKQLEKKGKSRGR